MRDESLLRSRNNIVMNSNLVGVNIAKSMLSESLKVTIADSKLATGEKVQVLVDLWVAREES